MKLSVIGMIWVLTVLNPHTLTSWIRRPGSAQPDKGDNLKKQTTTCRRVVQVSLAASSSHACLLVTVYKSILFIRALPHPTSFCSPTTRGKKHEEELERLRKYTLQATSCRKLTPHLRLESRRFNRLDFETVEFKRD